MALIKQKERLKMKPTYSNRYGDQEVSWAQGWEDKGNREFAEAMPWRIPAAITNQPGTLGFNIIYLFQLLGFKAEFYGNTIVLEEPKDWQKHTEGLWGQ